MAKKRHKNKNEEVVKENHTFQENKKDSDDYISTYNEREEIYSEFDLVLKKIMDYKNK